MLDLFCKINFGIVFTMKDLIIDLQNASVLLEPLGRICDLLDSSPEIEPTSDPAWIEVSSHVELERVLSDCEVVVASRGVMRTVVGAKLASSAPTTSGPDSPWPVAGAVFVSLKCADFQFIRVTDKKSLEPAKLEYPGGPLITQANPSPI